MSSDKFEPTCKFELSGSQFSVLEVLFVSSLVGVVIGTFIFVSQSLVLLVVSLFLTFSVTRLFPPFNPIAGAVRGFLLTGGIAVLLVLVVEGDILVKAAIVALLPPLGYCLGFLNSELAKEY